MEAFVDVKKLVSLRVDGDALEMLVDLGGEPLILKFPKHAISAALPFIMAALSKDADVRLAYVQSREAAFQVSADGEQVWLEFLLDGEARLPIEIGWQGLQAIRDNADELLEAGPSRQRPS